MDKNNYYITYDNNSLDCTCYHQIPAISAQDAADQVRVIFSDGISTYANIRKVELLTDMRGEWV